MARIALLLRGINVGGKNPVSMPVLRQLLEASGCTGVRSYLNSGNLVVTSSLSPAKLASEVEQIVMKNFKLTSDVVRVLALDAGTYRTIIAERPKGFGAQPDVFHSDVIFLLGVAPADAMTAFRPREGVDQVWAGSHAIYSQRLSAERTKSRLGAITQSEFYASMTIRNWRTTRAIEALLDEGAD